MAELLAETERMLADMFGGESGAAGVGNRPAVKTERRDASEERAVGGPAKRKASPRWTAEEDALALRMRGEGKTHLEIGAALGRSGYAVVNRMAKRGAVVAAGGAPETGKSEAFWEKGANSKRAEDAAVYFCGGCGNEIFERERFYRVTGAAFCADCVSVETAEREEW
jgi:hypothetical protein